MKTFFFAFLLSLMAGTAYAAVCTGPVTSVGVDQSGILWLGGPGGLPMGTLLCNVNASANGIGVEGCKAWYALFLAARNTGQSLTLQFNDATACASRPSWAGYSNIHNIWQ